MQVGKFVFFLSILTTLFYYITSQLLFRRPYNAEQFRKLSVGESPRSHLTI